MKTTTLAIALAALLCGCRDDSKRNVPLMMTPHEFRVNVTRIGVIADDVAYSGMRGIYLITDTKTGAEYIGVSGVGISELGSHRNGKQTTVDER